MSILSKIRDAIAYPGTETNVINTNDMLAYKGQTRYADYDYSIFDGGKFAGGFGDTQIQYKDYWTMRERSTQLFNENLYAKGLIRRLVTNVINTGLTPECIPEEAILGFQEGALNDWSEDVESRFALYGRSKYTCDYRKEQTFGALQKAAYMEALIGGDVLVVLRRNRQTNLPMIELYDAQCVQTPYTYVGPLPNGNDISYGVECDPRGRVVAYHVRQEDYQFKRLPAYGEKSGRRLAWLVYGTEKRIDEVRGMPLLATVLQSLKEIDRYRDSVQRKALINSIVAMVVKKDADKPGTLPMTGAAMARAEVDVSDNTTEGTPRRFNIAAYNPGVIVDELQTGEDIEMKGGEGTDMNFGAFEEAIIQSIGWTSEVPPEILKLAFSNNYSASQAAINEFKIFLNRVWKQFGDDFCTPVFNDWLVSEVRSGKIQAPGLLEASRDPRQYDTYGAWTATEWIGSIKPSTDMYKQAKASAELLRLGLTTRAREARVLNGVKYSKVIKRLEVENQQLAKALEPILQLQEQIGAETPTQVIEEAANILQLVASQDENQ